MVMQSPVQHSSFQPTIQFLLIVIPSLFNGPFAFLYSGCGLLTTRAKQITHAAFVLCNI